jgi:hypothetical protein
MGILEKLGLNRKKAIQTSGINEKARLEEQKKRRNNLLAKLGIALSFLILVMVLYPRDLVTDASYQLNETWTSEDLTAPFTFSILKTEREIEQEKSQIRQTIAPVFHHIPEIQQRVTAQIDSVMNQCKPAVY